jgi:hypothetical protein
MPKLSVLKCCFQDYFVLLPAAFYEATILADQITAPCEIGNGGLCRHFRYPNLTRFDMVRGEGGYRIVNEEREPLDVYFNDQEVWKQYNFTYLLRFTIRIKIEITLFSGFTVVPFN